MSDDPNEIVFGEQVSWDDRQQGTDGGFFNGAYELIPGPQGDPGPIGPTGPAGPGWEIIFPAAYVAYWPPAPLPEWGLPGFPGMHTAGANTNGTPSLRREGRTARYQGYTDAQPGCGHGSTLFTLPVGFEPESDAYFLVVTMHAGQGITYPVKPALIVFKQSDRTVRWVSGGYVPGDGLTDGATDVLLLGFDGISYSCPEAHA